MEESLISSAAPPLLLICTKIIKTLHGVRPKLKPAPITMTSVTTECFGLHEALARVQQLESMGRQAMHASPFEKVSRSITAFFYGCSMSLSVIDEYAMELNDAVQIDRPGEAALHQNSDLLKIWKEKDMQELLSQIREYRKRLSDLLQAVEAGRAEPENGHANTKDHASVVGLLSRSRSSFLTGTDSTRSSLRDSILSLDPSPPYALSLYAYSEKAATRSTETLHHGTPEPELLLPGDATAPPAHKQSEENIEEGTTKISLKRASPNAMPVSQGKIRSTINSARDKGSPVILEPYTSGLDQTANSDSADLKSVGRKSPESSLPQLDEAMKIEPHTAGGIGQRRDINFSRPLTVSSINEIPSDEEWSKSHGPGQFVVQEGHDDVTTYSDNELYDLALRTSSHESILLATTDWREEHGELSNLVATNSASDSTEPKDIAEQGPLSSEKARTSQEATDSNTVTYLTSPNKRAKPCRKLRGNQRYKIAVAGDGNSGSHALVNQFLGRSGDDEDPTNEDFYCKNCRIDENDVTIEIVDTDSLTTYYSMRDDHLRLSHGFIFVYSITSLLSLNYIENLYAEINNLKDVGSTGHRWPKILMANHTESEASRTVGLEVGLELARKMDCILIESAFKNEEKAIEAAFHDLVREICYLRYENPYPPTLVQVNIEEIQKAFAANEPPASRRSLRGIFGWGRP